MRKLILFNHISLDGFFAGLHEEIDWTRADEEHHRYAMEQIQASDLLVFGRYTYQLMANFWPKEEAASFDPAFAREMNAAQKLVFSRSLISAGWENTRLSREDPAVEIARLKSLPGKNICILGSAQLASRLVRQGLVDEFQVVVNPVVLGSGRPLFQNLPERIYLERTGMRSFENGNMLLVYRPAV